MIGPKDSEIIIDRKESLGKIIKPFQECIKPEDKPTINLCPFIPSGAYVSSGLGKAIVLAVGK